MRTSEPVNESEQSDPSRLAHHFSHPEQQFDSARLGMWIFLGTEVLFFGGVFCAYAVYRRVHPEVFFYGHRYLDVTLGGINTFVLISSSLTMAWAVRCAQLDQRRGLITLLILTLLGAFTFLGIKYVEYEHKWKEGLFPGKYFRPQAEEHSGAGSASEEPIGAMSAGTGRPAAPGEKSTTFPPPGEAPAGLAETDRTPDAHTGPGERPRNVHLFFGIYFTMTGLHGLHVIAGIFVITWILVRSIKRHFSSEYYTPVDLVGLYWHLVDIIWIFLFPLLYLIH